MNGRAEEERAGEAPRVEVSNDELRTIRDAMRELNRFVDALEQGEMEKVVLTRNGRMRAVVLPLEAYVRLVDRAETPTRFLTAAWPQADGDAGDCPVLGESSALRDSGEPPLVRRGAS